MLNRGGEVAATAGLTVEAFKNTFKLYIEAFNAA